MDQQRFLATGKSTRYAGVSIFKSSDDNLTSFRTYYVSAAFLARAEESSDGLTDARFCATPVGVGPVMGSDIEPDGNRFTLSFEAERKLTDELADLRERRNALAEPDENDAVADTGDSAESLRRAAEKARIDAHIAEIERLVSPNTATADNPSGSVERITGASVTIRTEDGSVRSFQFAMSAEARVAEERDQLVSVDSPLGQALSEAHEGDTVHYVTPGGECRATVERLVLASRAG